MKRLQEVLKQQDKPRILDVATGSGQFIHMITELSDNYEGIIGLDTSEKGIERARSSMKNDRVEFVTGSILDDLDIGLFDIITLSNSMHHFDKVDNLMQSIRKYLKEDGIVVINEMINDNQSDKQMTHVLMHHFWAEIDRLNGVCHNETYSSTDLLDYFKGSEFKLSDSWSLDYEEEQVLKPEDYKFLKSTLTQSLERVKEHERYPDFVKRADELKKRLDDIGFLSATSLIFILK